MARTRTPAIDRLRQKCVETPPPKSSQISTPCLTFTGTILPKGGHGLMGGENGKLSTTHRVAYEAEHGPIQRGYVVMHLCDNPACCNTDHMTLGTHKENMHDSILKGRHMGENTLPKLVKRIFLLQKAGKIPEEISDVTGYNLTTILSIVDFLNEDDYPYELALAKYGEELADRQRVDRLIYDQHTLTAIMSILATK